jgi:phenylacetate-CoA ligase
MSYYESALFRASTPLGQEAILSGRNLLRRWIYQVGGSARIRRELLGMECWDVQRLETYQADRLQNVVRSAATEVPYYRDCFRALGLDPQDIRRQEDLRRIPLIDRSIVQRDPEQFMARRARRRFLSRGVTTGTTVGTPLVVFRDLSCICWEEARLSRWRLRAGVRPGERRAILRGDHFAPTERRDHPWLHDRVNNLLIVSVYHLAEDLMPSILTRLREFAPVAVEGFPAALVTLAQFLLRTDQRLPVRAVLTSSERVYDHHRQALRVAFDADVFDQYGMAERVALASECSEHRLHLDMECSIVEVVRSDGTPCPVGEPGEIVGTCLTNFAMPLIRYRTGDVGELGGGTCACLLKRPVLAKLHGRDYEFVVGANGRRFSPTLLTYPFDNTPCIAQSQFVQSRPGHLLIRIVPHPGVSEQTLTDARHLLESGLQDLVGGSMQIDFEVLTEIAKGPNGKYRWVMSARTDRDSSAL